MKDKGRNDWRRKEGRIEVWMSGKYLRDAAAKSASVLHKRQRQFYRLEQKRFKSMIMPAGQLHIQRLWQHIWWSTILNTKLSFSIFIFIVCVDIKWMFAIRCPSPRRCALLRSGSPAYCGCYCCCFVVYCCFCYKFWCCKCPH